MEQFLAYSNNFVNVNNKTSVIYWTLIEPFAANQHQYFSSICFFFFFFFNCLWIWYVEFPLFVMRCFSVYERKHNKSSIITEGLQHLLQTCREKCPLCQSRSCPAVCNTYSIVICMCTKTCFSYGPRHAKMCLMPYANNKGADQPAHPRSLAA